MSENNNNTLESLAENIAGLASGIPAPIQKNFFKAFAQLCSASVDVPIAWLEGQADIRRTNTEVRKKIINQIGENLNQKIDVPSDYSVKAVERYASKLIKQQVNIDKIVKNTSEQLAKQEITSDVDEEISEEWLNTFEEIAKLKSSEDMQFLFGKILANEIQNPGAFSLKTLNTVTQLDADIAKRFMNFCSCCIHVKYSETIHASFFPSKLEHHLEGRAEIYFYDITQLKDYGLLHTTPVSYNLLQVSDYDGAMLQMGSDLYTLIFIGDDNSKKRNEQSFEILNLTLAGVELVNALAIEAINNSLFSEIQKFLNEKKFEITKT